MMSHYAEVEVQFNNKEHLVQALVQAGFRRDQIEVHENAVRLNEYNGSSSSKRAHVVIRREHVGRCCNDYGVFVDARNGSQEFVCDFAKQNRNDCVYNARVKEAGGFDGWRAILKREYAVVVCTAHLHEQGLVPERVDTSDGRVLLYANA